MTDTHLIAAGRLLGDCAVLFAMDMALDQVPALLNEARAHYDAVPTGDPVRDATVAIGRSVLAMTALRVAFVDNPGLGAWDVDDVVLDPDGLAEYDEDEVTRPAAEEAARAARAAFDADPEDPLVPLQLGMALAWLGDLDGATTAYREALRREPSDVMTVNALCELEEEAEAGEARRRSRGFATLLVRERMGNSGWSYDQRVFGDPSAARRAAEKIVREHGDVPREELAWHLGLTLETHRPHAPAARLNVVEAVPPGPAPFRVTWPDAPEWAPREALPAGRIIRLNGDNWFPA